MLLCNVWLYFSCCVICINQGNIIKMKDYPVYIKPPEPVTISTSDLKPKAQVKWKPLLLMTTFSIVVVGFVSGIFG